MKKSITVKDLKKHLKSVDDKLEVFVGTGEPNLFGVDIMTTIVSARDDKHYFTLMSYKGDVIKI